MDQVLKQLDHGGLSALHDYDRMDVDMPNLEPEMTRHRSVAKPLTASVPKIALMNHQFS